MPIHHAQPQTYWAIEGQLRAGFYPGSPDPAEARLKIDEVLRLGIQWFVDLTEEGEVTRYGALEPYTEVLEAYEAANGVKLTYRRHPIPDLWVLKPVFNTLRTPTARKG